MPEPVKKTGKDHNCQTKAENGLTEKNVSSFHMPEKKIDASGEKNEKKKRWYFINVILQRNQ